jgi:HAMP domain-containing protein
MNRTVVALLAFIAIETAFLGFVLVAFNARIDRIESATHAVKASVPPRRNDLASVRF